MDVHFTGNWESIKAEMLKMVGDDIVVGLEPRPTFPEQVERIVSEDMGKSEGIANAAIHHGPGVVTPPMIATPPAPQPPAVIPPLAIVPPTQPPVLPPDPPPAATSQELDTAGFPWDSRIHASTKSKISKGEWKLKRGVDPVLVNGVQSEFKAGPGQPTATALAPVGPSRQEQQAQPAVGAGVVANGTAPETLELFVAYLNKIDATLPGDQFVPMQNFMASLGLPAIQEIQAELYPEIAGKLQAQFQVPY